VIDYATEVRRILLDPASLCSSLGLMTGAKQSGSSVSIRCPSHDDHDPSCSVRIGQDGTIQVKCHGCDFAGDALHLIAKARGLDLVSAEDFREVMAIGAEISGDLRLSDEIRTGKRDTERQPAPAPSPQSERSYPDQAEVLELWDTAHPCESAKVARDLLESRAIDPIAATERHLLRVVPPGAPVPSWAKSGGVPWSSSGYRMIARVVDHLGAVRSVRAWQIDGLEGPKRKPPSGKKAAGLVLANREAAKMLAGKSKPKLVVIVEGEPDWATWATRASEQIAVIGIGSGSWAPEFANRLPKGCRVFVRVHCDPAGDKYAANVIETIGERCDVWRLTPGASGLWIDENDKAKAGSFPVSPDVDCVPANEAARVELENRPRIFSVRELLQGAHARVISTDHQRILTAGHWKVDMMTGGIRPVFNWVFGADTSWGKSAWALMLADENLKNGYRTLIISAEDDEDIYGDRLLARRSGVDATRIRDKRCDAEDHKRICAVLDKAEPIPVYLDIRGMHFERAMREILAVTDGEGIDLTILDYIGECRLKKKSQDERLMFKEIAQMYRFGIKGLKRASITLSQLTIEDPSKPPTKKNIRECRDIGSGAEGIFLGWKPTNDVFVKGADGREEKKYSANDRVLIIEKAKGGKCGSVLLDWDDLTASFNRVIRPVDEVGYEIPGFERADFDDLDDQFPDAF
jgi:hypothetical protein